MGLLRIKQGEDRRRLEEQVKADMEAQREQMSNMVEANMDELRKDREAIIQQNQTLKETTLEQMHQSVEQRKAQVIELQKQITALANRPPPPPAGVCVIL